MSGSGREWVEREGGGGDDRSHALSSPNDGSRGFPPALRQFATAVLHPIRNNLWEAWVEIVQGAGGSGTRKSLSERERQVFTDGALEWSF